MASNAAAAGADSARNVAAAAGGAAATAVATAATAASASASASASMARARSAATTWSAGATHRASQPPSPSSPSRPPVSCEPTTADRRVTDPGFGPACGMGQVFANWDAPSAHLPVASRSAAATAPAVAPSVAKIGRAHV